jgi:hypothetical protein
MVLRWMGFAAGLAVVGGTWLSVLGTLVVPRGVDSRISRTCDRGLDYVFRHVTGGVRVFARRDRILAWQSPVTLIIRLALWIALLLVGYGLMLLPTVRGPWSRAFGEAGSSMLTLGYAAPSTTSSTIVEYLAAYTGLVVVGLQIGYLPTLYAAFNRREAEVTLLISRAGLPAWVRRSWPAPGGVSTTAIADRSWTSCSPLGSGGRPRSLNPTPPTSLSSGYAPRARSPTGSHHCSR